MKVSNFEDHMSARFDPTYPILILEYLLKLQSPTNFKSKHYEVDHYNPLFVNLDQQHPKT